MTSMTNATQPTFAARPGRKGMTVFPAALVQVYKVWQARRRSRIALSHLSAFHLRDIGLDPIIGDEEVRRPFWR